MNNESLKVMFFCIPCRQYDKLVDIREEHKEYPPMTVKCQECGRKLTEEVFKSWEDIKDRLPKTQKN